MNYLKQALMELLSGLTTKKNEKEIWTQDIHGDWLTIEPIDDKNYILRRYWENGQLSFEGRRKDGQWHGVCKYWHYNGQLSCEDL